MTENRIRSAAPPTRSATWPPTTPSGSPRSRGAHRGAVDRPPREQRFAADVDGSDPATYPGIYGVFPLTLSIPGPDAGVRQVPCAGLTGWVCIPDHRRKGC